MHPGYAGPKALPYPPNIDALLLLIDELILFLYSRGDIRVDYKNSRVCINWCLSPFVERGLEPTLHLWYLAAVI